MSELNEVVVVPTTKKIHPKKSRSKRRPTDDLVQATCDIDSISPKSQRDNYLTKPKCEIDLKNIQKHQAYSPETLRDYEQTLSEWRQKGAKMAYIYDYVTNKYRKKLDHTSIAAFIITSLTTLLALSNLGLDDSQDPTLVIVLKGTNAALAMAAVITTGIPRLLGWEHTKDACHEYLSTVDNLISSVMSEQALPLRFRTDPEQYILENKDKYQMILDQAPKIPHDDYIESLERYEQAKARFRNNLVYG